MVAYSFQDRFVEPIRAKRKRQTIRALGTRRHARPGEELQLYNRMRQKSCKLVARETCATSTAIFINFDVPSICFDGDVLLGAALNDFAQLDGFSSWADMVGFWSDEHFGGEAPSGIFEGVLIRW